MILLAILFLIGIAAGITAGMLGVGGGLIFTPVLFFLFQSGGVEQPVLWTIGSSLFCTFIASMSSISRQYQQANIFLRDSILVGSLGIIGTVIGKTIAVSPYYSSQEFAVVFATVLLYASWSFYKGKKQPLDTPPQEEVKITFPKAFVTGGLGGLVASLAGVGGGIVLVPVMTLLFRIPFTKAVSISSFAIVFISLAASTQLALEIPDTAGLTAISLGFVDFGTALPLMIGSFIGAHIGVRLTQVVNKRTLELVFAVLAVVVAIKLLYDTLL